MLCPPQNVISFMFLLQSTFFLIKMKCFHIQNRCLIEKHCSSFSKSYFFYTEVMESLRNVRSHMILHRKSEQYIKRDMKIKCFGRGIDLHVLGGRCLSHPKFHFLFVFGIFWDLLDQNDMFSYTELICPPQNIIYLM